MRKGGGDALNQSSLLAAPLSADEQLNGDDLLASLTTDEWALVDADAMG